MGKRGLGRGLSALIPEATPLEAGAAVRSIPIGRITPNPFQPRTLFDPIRQEELVASIREHGILQPIMVREVSEDRFQLVLGERRFRAAQVAGLNEVPALVRACSDRDQLEMAIVENVQREDIGVLEAARAYRRMIDEFQMTQETIAARVGKSRSSIANTLRLLALPEPVLESLERGEITEGHGRALLSADGEEAIVRLWRTVVRDQLSVRDTEARARAMRGGEPARVQPPAPKPGTTRAEAPRDRSGSNGLEPNTAAVVADLETLLRTRVALRQGPGKSGKLEIEFYSDDDLERIAELILGAR